MNRNHKAFILVVVLVTLCVGLMVEPPARPVKDIQARPSTLFTDDTGARALFLVMQQLSGRQAVTQLHQPLTALTDEHDTLIVAGPGRPLGEDEEESLRAWLESGGQLILASSDGWERSEEADPFLATFGVEMQPKTLVERTVQLGDWKLWLHSGAILKGETPEKVHRAGDTVVAITIEVGEGQILALADPWAISNEALRKGDNALYLIRQTESWRQGRVAFDEYHHGFGEPASLFVTMGRFLSSPWGWPFAQLAVAGLLYVLLCRRRLGRVVRPPARRMADPMLLLGARAGLLQGAEAGPLALEQILGQLAWQLRDAGGRPADLRELQGKLPAEQAARLGKLLDESEQAHRTGRLKADRLLDASRLASQLGEELSFDPRA